MTEEEQKKHNAHIVALSMEYIGDHLKMHEEISQMRFERIERGFEQLERKMDEGFDRLDGKVEVLTERVDDLAHRMEYVESALMEILKDVREQRERTERLEKENNTLRVRVEVLERRVAALTA